MGKVKQKGELESRTVVYIKKILLKERRENFLRGEGKGSFWGTPEFGREMP